jgi:hypothetical protein
MDQLVRKEQIEVELHIGKSIHIQEVLEVELRDGNWHVSNPEARQEWGWSGRNEYRNVAILDYLKRRLGIMPEEERRYHAD